MDKTTSQVNIENRFLPSDGEFMCHTKSNHITINRTEKYLSKLRWKLGLNTNPCIQFRRGSRCIYCGFLNYNNPLSPNQVGDAFYEVFRESDLSGIRRLELYVSGSFFDDEEVSPSARLEIIKSIDQTDIAEILLESRPEFITEENLNPLLQVTDPKRITIAIGVETMNDGLRHSLSKGFSKQDIMQSLHVIGQAGVNFQAYLLLNPPSINNDRKALLDIVNSSKEIIQVTRAMNCDLTLAIQPFFLAGNSMVANDPTQKDTVKPPWLYTVALALNILTTMTEENRNGINIVLGNENDNVDAILAPSNHTSDGGVCECTEGIRNQLREVNTSREKLGQTVLRILESPCNCRKVWQNNVIPDIDDLKFEKREMEALL